MGRAFPLSTSAAETRITFDPRNWLSEHDITDFQRGYVISLRRRRSNLLPRSRMRPIRIACAAVVIATPLTAQQPTRSNSLTLDQAIAIAQDNNTAFTQTKNARRIANAQVRQAMSSLLPGASARLSSNYQQGGNQVDARGSFANPDTYSSSYSFGLSYTIAPNMLYAPKAARAFRDASDADVLNGASLLRSQVTTQYIVVLQQEAQAAVSDSLVQSAQGQLNLVNAKLEAGAATIVEVRTGEVATAQAQVTALQLHNAARVERLKLYQLMGVDADLGATLTTEFPLTNPTLSLDSLISLGARSNPDLAAKRSRETAAEAQVKVARSQYLPTISLNTGYGAQAFGYGTADGLIRSQQTSVAGSYRNCMINDSVRTRVGLAATNCGSPTLSDASIEDIRAGNRPFAFSKIPYGVSFQVSLPIFNGYAREAQLEQQLVTRDNALSDVRTRALQIKTDVTQAYYNVETASKTVELQAIIASKSAQELAGAQEKYKVGAATFLDVTVARATWEKAQIDRVNAVYEFHKAFAALENAVGRPLR
jgi:outer membrane protein